MSQNYGPLNLQLGKTYKSKDVRKFGRKPVLEQKERLDGTLEFNDEELFYMNRVAFRLFKKKSSEVEVDDFINDLYCLQEGTFKNKLHLWFYLANVYEDDSRIRSDSILD